MSVAELSIKRPVTTIMLFVSMVVVGLIAAVRLPLEAMPDVSAPFLFIQLPYAGSTPEEVERTILRPVEETLSTMTDVKSMEGNATSEQGSVFLMFSDWDRDIEIAAAEARERIDAIRDDLPDDMQRYFVWKWSTSDEPALELRLTSKQLDLTKRIRPYRPRLQAPARTPAGRCEGRSGRRAAERSRDRDRPGPPQRARPGAQRSRHAPARGELLRLRRPDRRRRAAPARATGRRAHRPAAVARPLARQRRAPVGCRRRAPQAREDALRPSPRRSPRRGHRHLQGTRRQPGRRLAQRARRARHDHGRAGRQRHRPARAVGCRRERDRFADRPGRSRRHRPAAVDRGAVLLPAPLAVDA